MAAARRMRRSRFPRRRKQTLRRRRKQTIRRRRKQTIRRRTVRRRLQQRKRTRLPRRRKQTKRRRIVRRKLQPRKRKQLKRVQGPKMRVQKNLPRKQGAKRTCDEFVSKVLRQLHRDKIPISTKAKGKMISFIRRFYKNVSDKAKSSKRVKRTSTIGTKELQNALKRVMHKNQALELVKTIQRVSRH